ncbi:hypothetical protein GALL_318860 [mine drainage metagenome]|uniref:Uncharacterized protein n=1 Tax=mine drainage metagenome TaxID=410659 RepID=A0A1J5QRM6_9ZZZZ
MHDVAPQIVAAALSADASKLPAWTGVDLGMAGYAVVRINKVMARLEASQPTAAQDRQQYARTWSAAESQAYDAALEDQLKVQILVPSPTPGTARP